MNEMREIRSEPAPGNNDKAPKVTILYVDDDPTDRKLFELSLRKLDSDLYDLTCVATLDEVREFLSARSVDYFVSDNRLHPTTTFRDTLIGLEDCVIDGKIVVISSETDTVVTAEKSDLVHVPDMIRDKFAFFSDLRAIGLAALDGQQSEKNADKVWLSQSQPTAPAGDFHPV